MLNQKTCDSNMKDFLEKNKRLPTIAEYRKTYKGKIHQSTFYRALNKLRGGKSKKPSAIQKETCRDLIKKFIEKNNRVPSITEYRKAFGEIGETVFYRNAKKFKTSSLSKFVTRLSKQGPRRIPEDLEAIKAHFLAYEVKKGQLPRIEHVRNTFPKLTPDAYKRIKNSIYSMRYHQKNKKEGRPVSGPLGKGRPAEIYDPAPISNGSHIPTAQILYTSDITPAPEIMTELTAMLTAILSAGNMGIPAEQVEIRQFHPQGFELRRVFKNE